MLKTGITTLDEARDPAAQRGLFGGLRKISITLYPQAAALPDQGATAQRILHQFTDNRGAYKRTYARRFPDFDRDAARIIQENFKGATLSVHDAAISDGRTAADFFKTLSPLFPDLSYTGSDYNARLSVVRRGRMSLTRGDAGQLLEVCYPPFVFNTMPENAFYYPVNAAARKIVMALASRLNQETPCEEFFLYAPDALSLAARDSRFTLAQHDILTAFTGRYDVIRAMNVLNLSYFSKEEFHRIARHIHDGLKEGGLFIAGSNDDAGSTVDGAIYRRTPQGFEEIHPSGAGLLAAPFFAGLRA